MNPGVLSNEAYGVRPPPKTSPGFEGEYGHAPAAAGCRPHWTQPARALLQVGNMTQDLIWEEYTLPVDLQTLQKGNSSGNLQPIPVVALVSAAAPEA